MEDYIALFTYFRKRSGNYFYLVHVVYFHPIASRWKIAFILFV